MKLRVRILQVTVVLRTTYGNLFARILQTNLYNLFLYINFSRDFTAFVTPAGVATHLNSNAARKCD
jgi:hypothetical protein